MGSGKQSGRGTVHGSIQDQCVHQKESFAYQQHKPFCSILRPHTLPVSQLDSGGKGCLVHPLQRAPQRRRRRADVAPHGDAPHNVAPATDRVFRGPTARRGPGSEPDSPPRWSVSPPSLSPMMSPLRPPPFLVQKALKTVESEEFVFPCRTAIRMPEPQVSLVFGRKQAPDVRIPLSGRKTGEFQPAELVTVCHRFVTASSPLSLGPKSAQKAWKSKAGSAASV